MFQNISEQITTLITHMPLIMTWWLSTAVVTFHSILFMYIGSPFHVNVTEPFDINSITPVGGWHAVLDSEGKMFLKSRVINKIDFDTSRASHCKYSSIGLMVVLMMMMMMVNLLRKMLTYVPNNSYGSCFLCSFLRCCFLRLLAHTCTHTHTHMHTHTHTHTHAHTHAHTLNKCLVLQVRIVCWLLCYFCLIQQQKLPTHTHTHTQTNMVALLASRL